jgi:arylsulfatase A-like enzyme
MPAQAPNLLLITTDRQRFDTVPPGAPSFLRTPHYDHLCREGIQFAAAYADCSICVPARVSIMTGKHVFTHGMFNNGPTSRVMGREGTLPSLLRALGYQTIAVGKMHFGPQRVRHGFDEMILPEDYYRHMRRLGYGVQMPMRHGLGQCELYPSMATVPESLTLTSWIAEQCVEYIRERRDPSLPFFLWCSFTKPHGPLDPPEPYYSMYRNEPVFAAIPEPACGDWSKDGRCPRAFRRMREKHSFDLVPPEILREARAAYYGLITQIDYNLGRVLAALQDVGLLKETLILYIADHGVYLGEHGAGNHGFFHEPSAHVPCVLRLPQSWQNRCHGTTVSTPVTHADVLSTFVAAAGGEVPGHVDGQDLTALARGELKEPRQYLEATAGQRDKIGFLGITDGRWKYSWYPEGPSEQLFDLATDPQELRDLAGLAEFEGKRRELHQEMIERHEARGSRYLEQGRLIRYPLVEDSERDRRNASWPGYHTDYYDVDVRH